MSIVTFRVEVEGLIARGLGNRAYGLENGSSCVVYNEVGFCVFEGVFCGLPVGQVHADRLHIRTLGLETVKILVRL